MNVNDTMNRAMETLARLDTWLVLIVCGWLVLVWLAPHLARLMARLMRYVKRSILTGVDAARFDARTGSEPREPASASSSTVSSASASSSTSSTSASAPAGRPDPAPDYPSVWQVLAKMIVANAISTSEAYRLLGVSRGASTRYQTAAANLAAAVAAERKANYGERSDTFTVSEHGRPVRTLRKADDADD